MAHVRIGWMDYALEAARGGAITIGNFDGVHRGHQALIDTAKVWSAKQNGPCVAVTFDPPPQAILNPDPTKLPLMTLEDRAKYLHEAGADHVVTIRTEPALLAIGPDAFFEDVLLRQLGAKAIVEGADFRFGRKRAGDVALLGQYCRDAGIDLEIVKPVLVDGDVISSSRIRQSLNDGQLEKANAMFGREFAIRGKVVEGAKRGRTLGFPTANLDHVQTLVPAVGVYACRVEISGKSWPAAANVGPNPTFGEDARKIEVHLIGYSGNLYGHDLTVSFAARIRETKPFAGIDALKAQLTDDIQTAERLLANPPLSM